MTLQLGADVAALFIVSLLVGSFVCGVLIAYLLEEHHYRDYHRED